MLSYYFVINIVKKNIDILRSGLVRMAYFWNNPHQVGSKVKTGKPNNLKVFESKITKEPKQDIQNRPTLPLSERGDP
jgi:hypothetical protein